MPDRAVVECWWCKVNPALTGDTLCARCWGCKSAGLTRDECLEEEESEPRALVALSDDRQWLVVAEMFQEVSGFAIYRFDPEFLHSWRLQDTAEDTGQDAHEVLREFLESRGGLT